MSRESGLAPDRRAAPAAWPATGLGPRGATIGSDHIVTGQARPKSMVAKINACQNQFLNVPLDVTVPLFEPLIVLPLIELELPVIWL